MLLRRMLLLFSQNRNLERFFRETQLAGRIGTPLIAGETLGEALDVAYRLNRKGFKITLDYLGEEIATMEQAMEAVAEYIQSIKDISKQNLDAGLSVKLSNLGVRIDREQAYQNLLRVLKVADEHNRFVRVDMEGSDLTETTLEMVREAHAAYSNVGTVIQACLPSAGNDADRLIRQGIPVRLVKGVREDVSQDSEEVALSFMRLTETLMRESLRPAIATHDENLIEFASDIAFIFGLTENDFEFQMMYGIRRDLQKKLLETGHRIRIYLPYGEGWYGYLMRCLAERPSNLWLLLKQSKE